MGKEITMLIIDRIDNGIAVCEGENGKTWFLREYPPEAKEGDVLVEAEEGFRIDAEETEKRRQQALSRVRRIRSRRREEQRE